MLAQDGNENGAAITFAYRYLGTAVYFLEDDATALTGRNRNNSQPSANSIEQPIALSVYGSPAVHR